jgi:hypothetical protein
VLGGTLDLTDILITIKENVKFVNTIRYDIMSVSE